MYTFLIILILIVCLVLAGAVLLQSGQGGGLASLGGGPAENIVGGRQAETILTKGTWYLGAAFMFLALVLSVMSTRRGPEQSRTQELLQQQQQTLPTQGGALPLGPSAPASTAPAQGTTPAPATGNAPATPAPQP
ncbi:MAG TPA: preprotein translocase subunit SecG [Gemmatimonadales bacterium]|nr:preprotein translocase subunit SecG [Gemmatimonadales bacterium]